MQLRHAEKSYGIKDPLLEEIPVQKCGKWILQQFWLLNQKRGWGQMGDPLPIPYQEILAFSQLHGFRFSTYDVQILDDLDYTYMTEKYKPKEG